MVRNIVRRGHEVEEELAQAIKQASRSIGVVLEEFSHMADVIGEEGASLWMGERMVESNFPVDTELIECLAAVWRATARLVDLMSNRFEGKA